LATSKKLKKQIKNQITHRYSSFYHNHTYNYSAATNNNSIYLPPRFQDEFDDLKRDFRDLRGVHNAVEQDFHSKKPVLSKGSRKAALVGDEGGDEDRHGGKRKRMYGDVDQLISGMAKTRGSKNGFKAARQIAKKSKISASLE
jgi:hypothetical protein